MLDGIPNLAVTVEDCALLAAFAVMPRYPRSARAAVAPMDVAIAACRRIVAAVDAVFAQAQSLSKTPEPGE